MAESELSDEAICLRAFQARDDALISGAPPADAAWLGIGEIDRLVRERVRRQLGLPRPSEEPAKATN